MLLLPVQDQTEVVRYRGQGQPIDPATGQPAVGPGGAAVIADVVISDPSFAVNRRAFAVADTGSAVCSGTPSQTVLVVPFSATRKVLHIFNRTSGSETVDIGPSVNVTVGGGIPLYAGGGFTFDGQGAAGPFYAVSPVASTPLSFAEG